MKTIVMLLLAGCLAVSAATEEKTDKRFTVQPGGKLILDVDFGSVEIATNATREVVIEVTRSITRGSKAEEEEFLAQRPITFAQDGDTITVESRAKIKPSRSSRGKQSTEGKYTITVPSTFNARIKTAGGGIGVTDLTGDVKAATSGGGLAFTRLHGPLDGNTSGGGIRVTDCQGEIKINTSGGGIDVHGGAGSLVGKTSGGGVSVKDFGGPAQVKTSGGGINIEDIAGKVEGSTSGGSISAKFASPMAGPVNLETSGGGVTLRVPENSAFDLDASAAGGGVKSELPVATAGKPNRNHLRGPVNGGGKLVVLRTGGGSILVKKL